MSPVERRVEPVCGFALLLGRDVAVDVRGDRVRRMAACPKASLPWVRALLHSVYDQPDAGSVHAQFDRVLDALTDKLPKVAEHLEAARPDVLPLTAFPKEVWRPIWSNNPPSGSTGRSAAAPTSSASSPTATPSSASSAPSSPSSTTNGPKAAATSASTSSPAAASDLPAG